MVSDASKKKAAQKKAAAAAKRGGKAAAAAASSKAAAAAAASDTGVDKVSDGVSALQISDRTCTGVLCSHPLSRDIRVSRKGSCFVSLNVILFSFLSDYCWKC